MRNKIAFLFVYIILCTSVAIGANFAYDSRINGVISTDDTLIETNITISKFKSDYFAVWGDVNSTEIDKELKYFADMPLKNSWYKENMHKYADNELKAISDEIASISVDKIKAKDGIALRNTDLRCLPTKKPFFMDASKAGEGYPFDYLQNSRVYIAMPLKVLGFSSSKAFCFVKTPVGYGWIDTRDVGLIDKKTKQKFQNAELVAPVKDKQAAIELHGGRFVEKLNIGTILPKIGSYAYCPKLKDNGYVSLVPLGISYGAVLPKKASAFEISTTAFMMANEPYGWGGYLDNRDCSMFLRDVFINFGVVLPRNSADQASGYVDISKLSRQQKKEYIKANAKPWRSVFYMRGHIMLYVGIDKQSGEILAMHDAWGIKSFDALGNEGRAVLGGIVTTTLEEGKGESWYNEEKSPYINKIIGVKDLF